MTHLPASEACQRQAFFCVCRSFGCPSLTFAYILTGTSPPVNTLPKTCFILNPKAGPSQRHDMPALIAQHFGARGAPTTTSGLTERAGHAVELARAAAAEGFRVVVAVGGDGTVNEVGRGLLGTEAALGIVPQGSGNGLARHLKVPLGLPAALRRLAAPTFSRMDVGVMNGHPFFCTAGLGFDAHVSQHFAQAGTRGPEHLPARDAARVPPLPARAGAG